MSLHSWSNPGMERGDGFDHGVDASMLAWSALIVERTHSSMLSLSLSSEASGTLGSRSFSVRWSNGTSVLAHSRFLDGAACCHLQSIAISIGRWSESQSRLKSTLQWIV